MLEREIQADCPRCRGTGQVVIKPRVRHALALTLAAPCSCAAGRTIAAPAVAVRA